MFYQDPILCGLSRRIKLCNPTKECVNRSRCDLGWGKMNANFSEGKYWMREETFVLLASEKKDLINNKLTEQTWYYFGNSKWKDFSSCLTKRTRIVKKIPFHSMDKKTLKLVSEGCKHKRQVSSHFLVQLTYELFISRRAGHQKVRNPFEVLNLQPTGPINVF